MAFKHMERHLTYFTFKLLQIKTTMRMAKIKYKTKYISTNAGNDAGNSDHSHISAWNVKPYKHWYLLTKSNLHFLHIPPIVLVFPQKMHVHIISAHECS